MRKLTTDGVKAEETAGQTQVRSRDSPGEGGRTKEARALTVLGGTITAATMEVR